MDTRPLIVFFGTYDSTTHPRVGVLAEGFAAHDCEVVELNEPLGFDTASRVRIARQPWRAPALMWRIGRAWWRLRRRTRSLTERLDGREIDLVVVGYLGHLDVHLATRLFRSPVAVDYLIGLGDTATDRGLDGRKLSSRLLHAIDRRAAAAADIVLVDTDEQATMVPTTTTEVLTLAVGAPSEWFREPCRQGDRLRVVFFGLYTPLQGAVTIGRAIAALAPRDDIVFTMIGDGQDRVATQAAAHGGNVEWRDWIDSAELPSEVGRHQVCLGIFGDTPKAMRVVPNKVFQGAAAGCAIVTSDTPPQRDALGDAAEFVEPADHHALASALTDLADDPERLYELQLAASSHASAEFGSARVVEPLVRVMLKQRGGS